MASTTWRKHAAAAAGSGGRIPAGGQRPSPRASRGQSCHRREHFTAYGTAPDGRLFRGTRGGPLSESLYGRVWHAARTLALGPELAASTLARRPYDLRHAALSLWLTSGGDPAQIAARAGNSVEVLLTVYSHCIHGRDDFLNQQIDQVLKPPAGRGPCPSVKKPAVCTDRATPPKGQRSHRPHNPVEKLAAASTAMGDAVRHASVISSPGPPTAPRPPNIKRARQHRRLSFSLLKSSIRTRNEQQTAA